MCWVGLPARRVMSLLVAGRPRCPDRKEDDPSGKEKSLDPISEDASSQQEGGQDESESPQNGSDEHHSNSGHDPPPLADRPILASARFRSGVSPRWGQAAFGMSVMFLTDLRPQQLDDCALDLPIVAVTCDVIGHLIPSGPLVVLAAGVNVADDPLSVDQEGD